MLIYYITMKFEINDDNAILLLCIFQFLAFILQLIITRVIEYGHDERLKKLEAKMPQFGEPI